MKTKQKLIFTITMGVAALLVVSQFGVAAQQTMEPLIEFPSVYLYSDGSYTPDTTMLETLGVPQSILHSNNPNGFKMEITNPQYIEAGLRDVYYDTYLQSWRVSFTTIIEAPVLSVWSTENMRSTDQSINGIELNENENDIKSGPTATATSEDNMGLPFWYGDIDYLLENETDDSGASWEYGTDFLVSNNNILFLEDIGDYSANNLSVIVTYVEDLSYSDLSSANAFNVTLFNEPVSEFTDLWFRLDLENTNDSYDAYVANIELTNFDVRGGRYVLNVDSDAEDTRYQTNYIGTITSPVSPNAKAADYFIEKITQDQLRTSNSPKTDLRLSGWIDNTDGSEALSVPANFNSNAANVVNQARGWITADDLENSIKQSIVDKTIEDKITDISQVDDLRLTSAIMNFEFPTSTVEKIDTALNNAAEKYDDLKRTIQETSESTVKRILIVSDDVANEDELALGTFGWFNDFVETGTGAIGSIVDTTTGAVGSVLNSVGGFSTDIIGAVSGGTSEIIATTGGTVSSGAASIIGAAGGAVGSIGSGFAPLLYAVGAVIGIVVIVYVYNVYRTTSAATAV